MRKPGAAFAALMVAGFVTGGVAMPAFFRMADGSAGSGEAFDILGVWIVLALSFGLVFWILSRVFDEKEPGPTGLAGPPLHDQTRGLHPLPGGVIAARILIGIGLIAWVYWAVDFEAPRRLGYEVRNGKIALVLWGGFMAWGLWRKVDQRHGGGSPRRDPRRPG